MSPRSKRVIEQVSDEPEVEPEAAPAQPTDVLDISTEWQERCPACESGDLAWFPGGIPLIGEKRMRRCRRCRASAIVTRLV